MKIWLFLVLVLLAAMPASGRADRAGALLETGRQAYAAGRFAEAAGALAAAAETGLDTAQAGLCLDVATAWRLAGDPGRAALWLYRAHRADPADGRVARGLAAAGLAAPDEPLLLYGRLSPRLLWWTALAANALFWLGLAGFRLAGRPIPRPLAAVAAVLLVWLWAEAAWTALGPALVPKAVVLAETPARSAPEAAAEELFVLPPGMLVSPGPKRGGYRRVDAGNDRLGWIANDSLAPVGP